MASWKYGNASGPFTIWGSNDASEAFGTAARSSRCHVSSRCSGGVAASAASPPVCSRSKGSSARLADQAVQLPGVLTDHLAALVRRHIRELFLDVFLRVGP